MSEKQPQNKLVTINWSKVVNRLTLVISIGVIVNLIIIYFASEEFSLSQLLQFNPWYLLLALLFGLFPVFGHAFEIKIWSHYFKKDLSLRAALRVSVSTILGSAVTPTMVGGGPVKWGLLMHYSLRSGQAAAMLTFSALQELLFFLIIIPISIIVSDRIGINVINRLSNKLAGQLPAILIGAFVVIVVVAVIWMLLKRSSFGQKMRQRVRASFEDFKNAYTLIAKEGKGYFLGTWVINVLRWVSRFMVVLCLVKGLAITADQKELFLLQWMIYLGMTATPTPGGSGGAEAAFFLVFKALIPGNVIGVIILAWRFCVDYARLIFSAVMVNFFQRKD